MSLDSSLPDDVALRELAEWGVDLSLSRATLELTPTERLERMVDFLAMGEALHQSYLRRTEQNVPGDFEGHSEIER